MQPSFVAPPHLPASRTPEEGDIVALSPAYVLSIGGSLLHRMARGRLTMIEHVKGVAFGFVTWDFPELSERIRLEHLERAVDLIRRR